MITFLRYAFLRSLYPLLALGAIWGSLLWGPWLSLPAGSGDASPS